MFQKAVKYESKLRLAIAGPSGSGKTYTALSLATALSGKVAVIDTEHGSASKYADLFDFDVLNLTPPFHPLRYVEAIREAQAAGYGVVVIDSVSHAWNGTGGVLEIVEQASKKYKGNSYAGWQDGTPAQNALIEGIVGAGVHIIATMRSKQDYILIDKNGKQTPQKVGMAPVQRDGFEYEFDIFLDMDIENNAIVSKTRCPALAGAVIPKPGRDLAKSLQDWLTGEDPITIVYGDGEKTVNPGKAEYDAFLEYSADKKTDPPNRQALRDWLASKKNGKKQTTLIDAPKATEGAYN